MATKRDDRDFREKTGSPARWLSAKEMRLWRVYLEATRLQFSILDRQLLADHGITLTDYEILVLLSEERCGRLRMWELAEKMVTTRSGITRAIARLVEAGWVCRVRSDEDRRGASAELTEAGVAKLREASVSHVEEVRTMLFNSLTPRDVERFSMVFEEILATGNRRTAQLQEELAERPRRLSAS